MPAPTSNLAAIQTKVRRLTRSPSEAQLTTADLNNYINTFVVYDFPEHLRMFNLRTEFTFYTQPFQDLYVTNETLLPTNPLYDFQNRYISIHPPVYIAGFQSFYTQSREQFFNIYPEINFICQIGSGDNATTQYSGFLSNSASLPFVPNPSVGASAVPVLPRNVLFNSVGANNEGLAMVDVPVTDPITLLPTTVGNLYVPGTEAVLPTVVDPTNFINYVTGEFTVTFATPPGAGKTINSQTVPYVPSRPQALLFYDEIFQVRPVPDQTYRVNFEAYVKPTWLMDTDSEPALKEWWQFIALGSSMKVFQDRMDTDSIAQIMPEYKRQERLCLRRTLVQYANERTSTIYTEQVSTKSGWNGWGYGGGSF